MAGISDAPYDSLNLGDHVQDAPDHVDANRARLRTALALPAEPCWLEQVHGTDVAAGAVLGQRPVADAAVTDQSDVVLAILTADCLPVVLASDDGQVLGAAHAGWRSLVGGVLENTVAAMARPAEKIRAWLGPAIGPAAFEVGQDVFDAFTAHDAAAQEHFVPTRPGHWHADLPGLARRRLARCGVGQIGGGRWCTLTDAQRFFSYRRDGQCGRMATLIWRTPAP
ncbi:MAG: peptidoglycan editing factor PgeF [Gammaproteobacteria bacterium]